MLSFGYLDVECFNVLRGFKRFASGLFGKSILDDGGASGGFASDLTLLAFISVVILVGEYVKQVSLTPYPYQAICGWPRNVLYYWGNLK
jgi:hypothetical protein